MAAQDYDVLIACEFSGIVRDAFIARGHRAISCDMYRRPKLGPHIHKDVRTVLDRGWKMIVAFPPCTHLASIGAAAWPAKQKDGRQREAIDLFLSFFEYSDLVAVENPVGWMNTNWRKPDQIIEPWQFGDPWVKRTCLWLQGLPPLKETNVVDPQGFWVSGQGRRDEPGFWRRTEENGVWGSRTTRKRSMTFPGIASAMADQWGQVIKETK